MNYKELKEPCKTMITLEKCLGCNKLELPFFEADKNCKYAKDYLQEGKQIRINLNGENEGI